MQAVTKRNNMKIEYIKANGVYYYPVPKGTIDKRSSIDNICLNVCFIKKLFFGRFQIDLYDTQTEIERKGSCPMFGNQIPNVRIILYPSVIEEIKYS